MNNWVMFVKEFAKKNNLSYGDALKKASVVYKKSGKGDLMNDTKRKFRGRGNLIGFEEYKDLFNKAVVALGDKHFLTMHKPILYSNWKLMSMQQRKDVLQAYLGALGAYM